MRRPVGVKGILVSCCSRSFFFLSHSPLSPCFHPHSRGANSFRSVDVGRPQFSRCCHLFGALWFCFLQSGTRARPLTQSPELGFGLFDFSLPGTILTLLLPFCSYAATATAVRLLWCNGAYTSPLTHR